MATNIDSFIKNNSSIREIYRTASIIQAIAPISTIRDFHNNIGIYPPEVFISIDNTYSIIDFLKERISNGGGEEPDLDNRTEEAEVVEIFIRDLFPAIALAGEQAKAFCDEWNARLSKL